jgi:hypothetical protein
MTSGFEHIQRTQLTWLQQADNLHWLKFDQEAIAVDSKSRAAGSY